jgi:NTE family protein
VRYLQDVWAISTLHQVYRADALGIGAQRPELAVGFMFGWLFKHSPRSLLDNTPLRHLLERSLDFEGSTPRSKAAPCTLPSRITASGYLSGTASASSRPPGGNLEAHPPGRVRGTHLGVDHLLASSAIPFIFPGHQDPPRVFRRRLDAPAGAGFPGHPPRRRAHPGGRRRPHGGREGRPKRGDVYPPLAQIAGHALSSIFLDSLHVDLERLQRINHTVSMIPPEVREKAGLPLRRSRPW